MALIGAANQFNWIVLRTMKALKIPRQTSIYSADFRLSLSKRRGLPGLWPEDATWLSTQNKRPCKSGHARGQFSPEVGTIFEDSPLGLGKQLPAV